MWYIWQPLLFLSPPQIPHFTTIFFIGLRIGVRTCLCGVIVIDSYIGVILRSRCCESRGFTPPGVKPSDVFGRGRTEVPRPLASFNILWPILRARFTFRIVSRFWLVGLKYLLHPYGMHSLLLEVRYECHNSSTPCSSRH